MFRQATFKEMEAAGVYDSTGRTTVRIDRGISFLEAGNISIFSEDGAIWFALDERVWAGLKRAK